LQGRRLASRIEATFSVTSKDRQTTTDSIEKALEVGLRHVTGYFRDDRIQAVRADTFLKLAEIIMLAIHDIATTAIEVLSKGNSIDALTVEEVLQAAHEARSYIFGYFTGCISKYHTSFHNPCRFVSMLSLFLHRPVFRPNNVKCNLRRESRIHSFVTRGCDGLWDPWRVLCDHLRLAADQPENRRILNILQSQKLECQAIVLEKSLKWILGASFDGKDYGCRVCGECFSIIPCDNDVKFDELWATHPCKVSIRDRRSILTMCDKKAMAHLHRMYQQLDEAQRDTVHIAINGGRICGRENPNLLIMGRGGTGKSAVVLVIRWAKILMTKFQDVACSAMTKQSANNIHGSTLHKISGLGKISKHKVPMVNETVYVDWKKGMEDYTNSKCIPDDSRWKILQAKVLIIDEVFSCDADFFRAADWIFRCIRNEQDVFFGGVQVILSGDCLQTGTVGYSEYDYITNGSIFINRSQNSPYRINKLGGTRYFCETEAFLAANFWVSLLETPHRFNKTKVGDQWDQDVLKNCAEGCIGKKDLEYFKDVVGRNVSLKYVVMAAKANYAVYKNVDAPNGNPTQKYLNRRNADPIFCERMDFIIKVAEAADPYAFLRQDDYYNRRKGPDKDNDSSSEDEAHVFICNENKQVDAYIAETADMRGTESWSHTADHFKFTGDDGSAVRLSASEYVNLKAVFESNCIFPQRLTITVGMVVKFLSNRIGDYVARNQLGIVQSFDRTNQTVIVMPQSSVQGLKCVPHVVQLMDEIIEHGSCRLMRKQFPLDSGRGTTVHSIKGATLNCIAPWDNVRGIRIPGSGYTAISRSCNPQDTFIVCKPKFADFVANPTGLALNRYIRDRASATHKSIFRVDFQFNYDHRGNLLTVGGITRSITATREENAASILRGEQLASLISS
jgi:hypothetical protein